MRQDVAGIILAGGRSSRMGGGDKSLLPLGRDVVLDHVLRRFTPQVRSLALSANGDPARFSRLALPVIADTVAGFAGPLAGILAGLEWAAANTECRAIATAAADTPFLPLDLVDLLARAASANPGKIAVARSDGRRHPTFALWPLACRDALRHFLIDEDNRRVSAFIDRIGCVEVEFASTTSAGETLDPFFNINVPDDLVQAEHHLRDIEP